MRLQTEVLAPGVEEPQQRTTPETCRVVAAVAEAIEALGYQVRLSEHRFRGIPASPPEAEVRDDAIQRVDLEGDGGIGLDILDGGIQVSGDAWHDEPQRFWATALQVADALGHPVRQVMAHY